MNTFIHPQNPGFHASLPYLVTKYVVPGDASAMVYDHKEEEFGGTMRFSVARLRFDRASQEMKRALKPKYFASAIAAELFARRWIVRTYGEVVRILGHKVRVCDYYTQTFVTPDCLP